ncbi:hypothetical protein HDU67_000065 [Dinochytrium kinnereticum]|nr:hypothetical protein HDU67_000065 [Dinochytrium kinnereticum]
MRGVLMILMGLVSVRGGVGEDGIGGDVLGVVAAMVESELPQPQPILPTPSNPILGIVSHAPSLDAPAERKDAEEPVGASAMEDFGDRKAGMEGDGVLGSIGGAHRVDEVDKIVLEEVQGGIVEKGGVEIVDEVRVEVGKDDGLVGYEVGKGVKEVDDDKSSRGVESMTETSPTTHSKNPIQTTETVGSTTDLTENLHPETESPAPSPTEPIKSTPTLSIPIIEPPTPPKPISVQTAPEPQPSTESPTPPPPKQTQASPEPPMDPTNPDLKTLKQRFNYASFDCGALILGTSSGSSSTSSILIGNKDQYMLSQCTPPGGGKRFVMVELCDNILIDIIAVANFEYFSSNFREFRVLVSERYPPKDGWKVLGNFLASNVRGIQHFSVNQPLIFARYMRIEFLSHYGTEFYCPLTLLRVYGTTEMEAFKAEEEELAKTNAAEEAEAIAAVTAVAKESVRNIGGGYIWTRSDYIHPILQSSKRVYPEIEGVKGEVKQVVSVAVSEPTVEEGGGSSRSSWILSPDYFREFMASEPFPTDSTTGSSVSSPIVTPSPSPDILDQVKPTSSLSVDRPAASTVSQGAPVTSTTQESIFKTISKRLSLLERNASLSYKYIEETSRAYHEAFRRVELSSAETVGVAVLECNRTSLKIVRELVRDYESSWRSLIRDIERDRMHSDMKIRDFSVLIEKVEEQMKRHIYTEIFLVGLIVLLASRIFIQSILPLRPNTYDNPISSPQPIRLTRPDPSAPPRPIARPPKPTSSGPTRVKGKQKTATVVSTSSPVGSPSTGGPSVTSPPISPVVRPGGMRKSGSLFWWFGKGEGGERVGSDTVLGEADVEELRENVSPLGGSMESVHGIST